MLGWKPNNVGDIYTATQRDPEGHEYRFDIVKEFQRWVLLVSPPGALGRHELGPFLNRWDAVIEAAEFCRDVLKIP